MTFIDTLSFQTQASILPYLTFMDLIMVLQVSRDANRSIHDYWEHFSHQITFHLVYHESKIGSRVMNYLPQQTFYPSISHCLWHIRGFMPRKKVFFNMYECRNCGNQCETPATCPRCELERVHYEMAHDRRGNWTWVTCA